MTHVIAVFGLPGIFVLMLLESACIPIPAEATMLFAGFAVSQGKMSLAAAIVVGVAGNVVGAWIAYYVGLLGGRPFIDRYGKYVLLRHEHIELTERWFAKYGAAAVLFCRVIPGVRGLVSLPAGVARMPLGKFTLSTASAAYRSSPSSPGWGSRSAPTGSSWSRISSGSTTRWSPRRSC